MTAKNVNTQKQLIEVRRRHSPLQGSGALHRSTDWLQASCPLKRKISDAPWRCALNSDYLWASQQDEGENWFKRVHSHTKLLFSRWIKKARFLKSKFYICASFYNNVFILWKQNRISIDKKTLWTLLFQAEIGCGSSLWPRLQSTFLSLL